MPDNIAAYAPPPMMAPDLPDASADKKDVPPGLIAQALQIPLRRWQSTAAILVISGLVGVGVGFLQSEKLHKVRGTLIYSAPPLSEKLKAHYTPNRMDTLAQLILTTEDLQTLSREEELGLPPTTLSKLLKPEQVPKSEAVVIPLDWEEPEKGARIVNRLMELHVARVDKFQAEKVKGASDSLERLLVQATKNHTEAKAKFDAWKAKTKVADPVKSEGDVAEKIKKLEESQKGLENDELQARVEQATLDQDIKKILDEEKQPIEALLKKFQDDPSYKTRLIDIEQKLSKEREDLKKNDIDLKKLENELAVLTPGVTITKVEYNQKKADAEKLRTAIFEGTKRVQTFSEQKDNLPRLILQDRRADLQKKHTQAADREREKKIAIQVTKETIEDLRKSATLGLEVLEEGKRYQKETEQFKKEMTELDDSLKALTTLGSEVRIANRATAAAAEDGGSTFKKKAIPPFAITFVLLMGLLIGSELKQMLGTTTNVAARMGLPVLSEYKLPDPQNRYSANQAGATANQSRGLALKMRQYLPEKGGTILFTSLNPGPEIEDLINDVSRYLTLQDERVLILDTRITEPQGQFGPPWLDPNAMSDPTLSGTIETGLVQYLVFEGQKVGDKVTRTRMPKADYLPAGGPCVATDILASQQMRELVPYLRRSYSVVLMVGPPLPQHIDLEILAGYVDGLVIVLNKPLDKGTDDAVAFVRNLKDLRAPLLGCVLCD